jgi:hypothetical protein
MKKVLLALTLLSFVSVKSQTCNSSSKRILMVGDSWSWIPWTLYTSMDDNLDKYGFTDLDAYSTQDLSVNGKKTKYLLDTAILAKIDSALVDNPKIDIINLSIGGNDFLRGWTRTMTTYQSDSVLVSIVARIDTIIQKIWDIDSTIKVHLPMYDFPNFEEVINSTFFPNQHPFYEAWEGMEFPNFLEINTQLVNIGSKAQALTNQYSHVTYVNSAGLMQNIYGQTTPLAVAPGGTYAPGTSPLPGGFPNYPSPINALRDYALGVYDCFHLNEAGYRHFYDRNFKYFYFNHLRSDRDTVFASQGENKDGFVNSTSFGSNAVSIGLDNNSNLTSGILTFNTSTIPVSDSVHYGKLFIKREGLTGNKPISGTVLLEIKNGYFGSSDSIDSQDFADIATASVTACVYGNINDNGSFLRIDIPANIIKHINKNGQTQFRISSTGSSVGEMFFANGNDTVYPPELDLYYSPQGNTNTTSIKQNNLKNNNITIYPNPNSGDALNVSFKHNFNGTILVFDITGKKVYVSLNNNQLDISNLPKGYYTIIFNDNSSYSITKRFVRM